MTNTFYPKVLRDNQTVLFKLKCRHFIEMVRRLAEFNLAGAARQQKNGHGSSALDMDLEASMVMDSDVMSQAQLSQYESTTLSYGQQLEDQYRNNSSKEIQAALRDMWGLLAYTNPLKEPQVSHLLDKKGRVAVSEELNSAILCKSSPSFPFRAQLELDLRSVD